MGPSEPAEPDLTPQAAVAAMGAAGRFERPIRTRTEGVTWMVWGLVTIAIFLSYDALSPHFRSFDHTTGIETHPPWYVDVLWAYWVVAGAALTYALWRIAGLAVPIGRHRPAGAKATVAWIGAGALAWALVLLVAPEVNEEFVPAFAIGLAWVLIGATNVQGATPLGRRVVLTTGIIIVVATSLVAWATLGHGHNSVPVQVGRALTAGVPPIVTGFWQALRG